MASLSDDQIVIWTARIAVVVYLCAVFFRLKSVRPDQRRSEFIDAGLWTAAWGLLLIHVTAAFHLKHHWSHTAALKHTSEMTADVTGLNWGGGLYINYLFLLWWGIDCARMWATVRTQRGTIADDSGPESGAPLRITGFDAVAAFMMFNATVVFGTVWWLLPLAAFLLMCSAVRSRHTLSR